MRPLHFYYWVCCRFPCVCKGILFAESLKGTTQHIVLSYKDEPQLETPYRSHDNIHQSILTSFPEHPKEVRNGVACLGQWPDLIYNVFSTCGTLLSCICTLSPPGMPEVGIINCDNQASEGSPLILLGCMSLLVQRGEPKYRFQHAHKLYHKLTNMWNQCSLKYFIHR